MIPFVFIAFIVLTVISACVVLWSNNVLYAAFSLLLTFFGIAALYVLVGADFIAITQLLVYVGGILVLLLFGVMLTNQNGNKENGKNDIIGTNTNRFIGFAVALGLFSLLFYAFAKTNFIDIQSNLFESIESFSTTQNIGVLLMTDFVLPFEVSGVLLMATLIGAAYLSSKTKV
ncbi:NADH-quinone oxidoreductase subunit J family protein [Arcicella lustrica]|uniref:NADH-quinone oxidoreductase subunit J n=1 Tax=Arcicella lustrica TaxID=2984196 RepID=A0ABU5SGD4_9BACT|nr:NADH-quinone oxidoreductase subunit J [Arcicella sp. DC25W]MEA5426326.1 NADH-quinone oxidoreductase subunit J [Arcicella sp. DC25W]